MEYIAETPIRPEEMFSKIRKGEAGSVLLHYAVVQGRAAEKTTEGIRFERNGDAEAELAGIAGDLRSRWTIEDILLVRRIGTLRVGDIISLVAVSCPRSRDAFEACQYGLERLKKMTALKKTELYSSAP